MPYKVRTNSSFQRDFKVFKKNKPAKELIARHVEDVISNPGSGSPYESNLSGLYKLTFGDRPQYRIIYRLYQCCDMKQEDCDPPGNQECKGLIQLLYVKTREECNNLYKKEKSYFDQSIIDGYSI